MKSKVCHLTSIHPRYDTRIVAKECQSLNKAGFDVSLIIADSKGDEVKNNINIYDVGKISGRLSRYVKITNRMLKKALEVNADVYHFHDPELIPTGLKLKKKGKKVIYDMHEDLPKQIYGKPYIKTFLKPVVSTVIKLFEDWAIGKFDYICTATPAIKDRCLKLNKNTVDINNYPILEGIPDAADWGKKENIICYVGGITELRGIITLIKAMETVDGKVLLAGDFYPDSLKDEVKKLPGWAKVEYFGYVNRKEAQDILAKSKIGIITDHPVPNAYDAMPNKLFEYMAAGLPVITSDFPTRKNIITQVDCGICVNPLSAEEIAGAANHLFSHDEQARQLGENGRQATKHIYNWTIEEKKLVQVYKNLT